MPTLYEISDELRAIEARLIEEGGEITDADFEGWIAATREARDAKIDNYVGLMREIEARLALRITEASRLRLLADADERALDQLRVRLQWFFETHGLEQVQTARANLKLVTNGGKLPLVLEPGTNASDVDVASLFRREIPAKFEFDTQAIRNWLDAGGTLSWAHYGARKRRLAIR